MGAAFYLVMDKDIQGFDTAMDGKALACDSTKVDNIAKSHGFQQLSEYVSVSPDTALQEMASLMGVDDPKELPPENQIVIEEMPEEKWYEASHGYEYASAVAKYIRQYPDSVDNADAVLHDLDAMAKIMEEAVQKQLKWHLAVDY